MENYAIELVGDKYTIREIPTGHHLKTFNNKSHAEKLLKKLNKGCGFEGQTPSFLLNRFVVK
jgi:hypothetical protein